MNILNLTLLEFQQILQNLNKQKYRANQIFEWIYKKDTFDFNQMTNLPETFRLQLQKKFKIDFPKISNVSHSRNDDSYKFLLKTYDNKLIESILILKDKRATICVSCMIGCPLKCKFCATGMELKFARNLQVNEIIGQVLAIKQFVKETFNVKKKLANKITNIVFMGMGEPLLNYENLDKSLQILTCKQGLEFSPKKITVSTAGVLKNLSKLINKHGVKLAVSLHFPTNELRNQYMPINQKYNIEQLIEESKKIKLAKRDFITIEYIMMQNINDSLEHAKQLLKVIRNLKVKINLIPYNPTKFLKAKSSTENQINIFAKFLVKNRIMTTVRRSKGQKIQGACGQFALKKSTS